MAVVTRRRDPIGLYTRLSAPAGSDVIHDDIRLAKNAFSIHFITLELGAIKWRCGQYGFLGWTIWFFGFGMGR